MSTQEAQQILDIRPGAGKYEEAAEKCNFRVTSYIYTYIALRFRELGAKSYVSIVVVTYVKVGDYVLNVHHGDVHQGDVVNGVAYQTGLVEQALRVPHVVAHLDAPSEKEDLT